VFVSDLTGEGKRPPVREFARAANTEPRRGSTETTAGPLSLLSEERERRICYSLTGRLGRVAAEPPVMGWRNL